MGIYTHQTWVLPTSDEEDEEIEIMHEQIEEMVKKEKATDQVIILRD